MEGGSLPVDDHEHVRARKRAGGEGGAGAGAGRELVGVADEEDGGAVALGYALAIIASLAITFWIPWTDWKTDPADIIVDLLICSVPVFLGQFLATKKRVLKCDRCGAVIDAS